ncbi:MAG: ATP-binding protein [Candidatus Krumholzibacteria bacterium]|nr:ATP-binding protein [Candidatus Krumholzibacteria bacterium]
MMSLTQGILAQDSVTSVYLLLLAALSGLLLFILVRGREATGREVITPLLVAVPLFAVGRVATLGPASELGWLAAFSLLNLVFFYFVALAIIRLTAVESHTENESQWSALTAHTLRRRSLYLGLLMGLVYLVASPDGSIGGFAIGLVNLALVGATVGALVFIAEAVYWRVHTHRPSVMGTIALVTASWVAMEITPLLSNSAASRVMGMAYIFDIAVLVLILGVLASNYVSMGSRFKMEASQAANEMDAAKKELTKLSNIASNIYEDSSDLIKKQKEQTLLYMKKAESLEKILKIGVNIQRRHQLDELLQQIAEMVRDNLGFKTVTLRLFNRKAQNFETQAHVGLSDEVKDTVVNYRIPITEYQKMIEPRFRISKSYFIRKSNTWYGEDLSADRSVLVKDTWGEIDMLIVPLLNEDQSTIGYLSVENPENPRLSVADVIETLENISVLAVVAIRNARFFQELEAKNEKLSIYADKLSGLNQLKANFVATISHEFRTPLTSIKAYCETLLKNADNVELDLLKQFLCVIDEESDRLMTLIDDILDFSQMESGAVRLERSPCELNALTKQASQQLTQNFENKQVKLHLEVPNKNVVVNGSSELIKQLMINLLHNASKFTREGGNVWLRVQEEPGSVRMVVEDDGIGIPEGQLARIFEQFYQVDNSSTRKHGGSGLGLAMCKSIIEWHDGRIWVENVSGRGARFVAVLPKKEAVIGRNLLGSSGTVRHFEIERFLELVVESVAEFIDVGKASIMLVDNARQELRIECAIGIDEEVVANARVKLGEGIAGRVAKEGRTMLVTNIEEDSRVTRSNNELVYQSKSFLCVPIVSDGDVIGVVNAASPLRKDALDEHDKGLLESLVDRCAVAIGKMRVFADATIDFEKVRETFKAILESKRYTDLQHEELINSYLLRVARKVGLSDEAVTRLHFVLNVYDLGLSKVGYHIIKNPKDISPKDREEIQKHTILGNEMLSSIETDTEVRSIVLYHHENFDGSGYPGNLHGEAIPIEARIVRVADALRALMSERPYQRKYTWSEALEILKHRSGTFFDPRVIDALFEVISESHDQDIASSQPDTLDETVEEHR